MNGQKPLRVGLAVGRGTGDELASVFETVIHKLASLYTTSVEIHRSPRTYHSYFSLLPESSDPREVRARTDEDVKHYEKYCLDQAKAGTRVIFRTAINAQSLYLVRQHQEGIKMECFNQGPDNSLLLIRDQAGGFYTGSNEHDVEHNAVSRNSTFSKDLLGRIVSYSISRAHQLWGEGSISKVTMVYKFHLFDGVFSTWAKSWSEKHGIKIEFVQPDTANRNLLAFGLKGRQLMIAGNEWADIMHVILLDMFGQGAQEARCTENIYLRQDLGELSEYQTVHGSADDIGGKWIVNPSASMRAAAAILERKGGCKGLIEVMDMALELQLRKKMCTRDQGGSLSSKEAAEAALEVLVQQRQHTISTPTPSISPDEKLTLGKKTALLVVDFQNDFVKSEGIGSHYRGSMERLEPAFTAIPKLLGEFRSLGLPLAFVRFLGDSSYQTAAWKSRDSTLSKKPKCVSGTWGSELAIPNEPREGDVVFDKRACFDAFLAEGLEAWLVKHRVEHLVLAGVYSDVCVDTTARNAFQRGMWTTVVRDTTACLHGDLEESLRFMEKVYGTRVLTSAELVGEANGKSNGVANGV